MMKTLYTCPVCTMPLEIKSKQLICGKNHQFDMAKEGYINLLLSSQKNSKDPGDTKDMLNARRDFLSKGYYDELTAALASIVSDVAKSKPVIMDIGCGDGHFIHQIKTKLEQESVSSLCLGSDISKPAIKLAAKLDKDILFAVASSFKLPVQSESLDYMIKMFAPCDENEIVRCLKSGGKLITVTPGPHHLYDLREVVYNSPRLHDEKTITISGMTQKYQESISYTISIDDKSDLRNLLTMTPYYWNGDREAKEKFDALESLTTRIDFLITVYEKL